MKKILLLLIAQPLLFVSQLLNPSFETVTANKPNNYNLGFYNSYQIRDTSDSHTGTHAAYIKSFGAQSYSIQGAVLGLFSTSGKPTALSGWYKCNIQPGDSLCFMAYVYPVTTFTTSFTRSYAYTTTSTAVYKQFTSVIDYSLCPATSYDSVFVSIYLSGTNVDAQSVFIPQTGTWAIIDDLVLGAIPTTGIEENNVSHIYNVGPNPCQERSMIYFNIHSTAISSMRLRDIPGKEIKTVISNEHLSPGNYKVEMDLTEQPSGIYFIELEVDGSKHVSKIIKN